MYQNSCYARESSFHVAAGFRRGSQSGNRGNQGESGQRDWSLLDDRGEND